MSKRELKTSQFIEQTALAILNDPPDKVSNGKVIGYTSRVMAQFGWPHRPIQGDVWERVNGNSKLRIVSNSGAGIASGSMPRLLMAWVGTWQVRHPHAEVIELGKNLSRFLTDDLGVQVTGGKRGYISKVKLETFRLFSSSVSIVAIDPERGGMGFTGTAPFASKMELWENRKHPDQDALFASYVILSRDFREQLIEFPIPIDLRAMPILTPSPLAMDYYCWLAHRFSYLHQVTVVTWEQLHQQFGGQYDWNTKEGRYGFKRESEKQLSNRVLKVYPQARIHILKDGTGLRLHPSPTPIPMTTKKVFLPQ